MKDNTVNLLKRLDELVKTTDIFKHTDEITGILSQLPEDLVNKLKKVLILHSGYVLCGADFSSLEDRISALTTKDPNKLKVYMGHEVFELTVNGVCHHIRDDDTIVYDGKTYTGKLFYENYTNGAL